MYTEYGPTLSAGQFQSPFNAVVEELVQKGYLLHESFRDLMGPQWKNRLLEILIVDNPVLDAGAMEHAGHDRICISRGALEHIYGNIFGLCSTPKFLTAIGNVGEEVAPKAPLPGGFPPVPLLRNVSTMPTRTQLFIPKDQTRIDLAETLVELALEFLIFHELGHILGGHLEIKRTIGMSALISEMEQWDDRSNEPGLWHAFECDADAFATHVTSWVHTHDKTAEILSKLLNATDRRPKEFTLLTYLMTIGALFRFLYPTDPVRITKYKGRHPHPAVRACLVASSVMAQGSFDGSYTTSSLENIAAESIGNLEAVWADLCLPGQNVGLPDVWAKSVGDAAMELFRSYGQRKPLLDEYARIPRRFDNWAWPEMPGWRAESRLNSSDSGTIRAVESVLAFHKEMA